MLTGNVFVEITLVLLVAVIVAGIMRLLKQPLIIGYIATGILVSPYLLHIIRSIHEFETFAEIGVALLLFLVGLHLNPNSIRDVGKISLITGLGQVLFTSVIGFLISRLLGFDVITSVYIAIALTFSSTIIIMKLLSDKKDMDTLYGRIAIGFLIVQDLVAVLILIVISSLSIGGDPLIVMTEALIKGVTLLIILYFIGKLLLPRITHGIAKSQEFLLFFSIAWCLIVASSFLLMGFSIEVGALLAGMALSMSPYRFEISSKLKPLRDFFIIMFFVVLGSQLVFTNITEFILPVIIFSVFILIGNPLIVIILMGALGYTKRNGFMAGLTVAQISEFSLILIALGLSVGHLSAEILSLVTFIGIITIAGSTYMIMYSHKIYPLISPYLSFFERKKKVNEKTFAKKEYDVILFGAHRIGKEIIRSLKKKKRKFLVVDNNPDTTNLLESKKINHMYGDLDDLELLDEIKVEKAKMVISTVPDTDHNLLLLSFLRNKHSDAISLIVAGHISEAKTLYEAGATYVIMPYTLGGKQTSSMIEKIGLNKKAFLKEQKKHLDEIN